MTDVYLTTRTPRRTRRPHPVTCWTCQRPFYVQRAPKPGTLHTCSSVCRRRKFVLLARWHFWTQVYQEGDCWIWKGRCTPAGYGHARMAGKDVLAHHFPWECARGPVPSGWHRDHLCRRTACVHPAHLDPVPPRINILRDLSPMALNAQKAHCPKGHPYTPENTILTSHGRRCRTCKLQRDHRRYHAWRDANPLAPKPLVTHCYRGHPYDELNTYWDNKGKRRCRQCKRDLDRPYAAARRGGIGDQASDQP
jgi:hypothetical protein